MFILLTFVFATSVLASDGVSCLKEMAHLGQFVKSKLIFEDARKRYYEKHPLGKGKNPKLEVDFCQHLSNSEIEDFDKHQQSFNKSLKLVLRELNEKNKINGVFYAGIYINADVDKFVTAKEICSDVDNFKKTPYEDRCHEADGPIRALNLLDKSAIDACLAYAKAFKKGIEILDRCDDEMNSDKTVKKDPPGEEIAPNEDVPKVNEAVGKYIYKKTNGGPVKNFGSSSAAGKASTSQ